jgi:hypothetical protein
MILYFIGGSPRHTGSILFLTDLARQSPVPARALTVGFPLRLRATAHYPERLLALQTWLGVSIYLTALGNAQFLLDLIDPFATALCQRYCFDFEFAIIDFSTAHPLCS